APPFPPRRSSDLGTPARRVRRYGRASSSSRRPDHRLGPGLVDERRAGRQNWAVAVSASYRDCGMTAPQWARLNVDVDEPIRRGAWYRVLQLTPREVTVDVKGRQVPIPRAHLEVVAQPALRWAVVPRPRNSPRLPPGWGPEY